MLFLIVAVVSNAEASPWLVWGGQSVYVGADAYTFQSFDNGVGQTTLPSRAGSGGGLVSWTAPLPRTSIGDFNVTVPAQSA